MRPLILASTSRYRKELLDRLGVSFDVEAPAVDEAPQTGETPCATALRLARLKALAVAARHRDAVVIGSDQTATLDGTTVIGKPGTHERAVAQLRAASGQALVFHTGLSVVRLATGFERTLVVDTRVRFRTLSDAQIERYLQREPAYDCAGSAKSEGLGISLLEAIEGGDPTALVGLPLIALTGLLGAAGIEIP
jgi:septum formation protein